LIESPQTKGIRRISAHCSTSTNDLLLARSTPKQARLQPHPDDHAPTPERVRIQPARGGEYSSGADSLVGGGAGGGRPDDEERGICICGLLSIGAV
jgi:hypothetical protein